VSEPWLRDYQSLTYMQRRPHHCRMGPPPRRPSILDPSRRLPAQAIVRNWWLGFNIHLRILRRKLEGEDE
jgi:hypothetical protein